MPALSHLFVMDPIEKLNLRLDSSLALAAELAKLGHEVYFAEPKDLFWVSPNSHASARTKRMSFPTAGSREPAFQATTHANLEQFSAIHMRKDPPFDMDYIATTWLLDTVRQRVRIYNDPQQLRSLNEKLAIFGFPAATKPALLSCDPERLLHFIQNQTHGDAVVKPLHLFGGRGVFRIELKKMPTTEAKQRLEVETENGKAWRLVQAFDPDIYQGEVRAFTAGGKAIAWCLKRPKEGSFLANTAAGATLSRYEPSAAEIERVELVAAALLRRGIVFIGFDIIGGFISEINITSPRLLQGPEDTTNYYAIIAKWITKDLGGNPA